MISLSVTSLRKKLDNEILLGNWCDLHPFNKKKRILNYHWSKTNKKEKDLKKIHIIYEIYLKKLTPMLNKIHNKKKPIYYWRIIIGPWLFQFISIIFDKWETLRSLKKENISYINIGKYNAAEFVPNEHKDFANNTHTDEWNNFIYGEIVKNFLNIPIKEFFYAKQYINKNIYNNRIKFLILKIFYYLINLFNFNQRNKVFFFQSYINFWKIIKISFKLNEWPYLSSDIKISSVPISYTMRNWDLKICKNKFFNILDFLIPKCIPKSYLENYQNILNLCEKLKLPKKPKYIVSAVGFDVFDFFKIWAAEKKYNFNTKFISIQHGGSYFITKFHSGEEHLKKISDYFLTWGYVDKKNKVQPFFKVDFKKKINPTKKGKLLFLNYTLNRFAELFQTTFIGPEYQVMLKEKILFFRHLDIKIINNVCIKDKEDFDLKRFEDKIFREESINIKRIIGNSQITHDILGESRILVTHLNSTGFLESLSMNFPTIVYFNLSYDKIRADAIPYIEQLKKANILFDDPISAARMINKVWDNVDFWWNSKKTQFAVNFFCNRYARTTNDISLEFIKFIKSITRRI